MHPAQPVPVRLDSESLDSAKGTSEGKQEGTKGGPIESQGSAKETKGKLEGTKASQGKAKEGAIATEARLYSKKNIPVCSRARVRGSGAKGEQGWGRPIWMQSNTLSATPIS